jgi:hypothetical protein
VFARGAASADIRTNRSGGRQADFGPGHGRIASRKPSSTGRRSFARGFTSRCTVARGQACRQPLSGGGLNRASHHWPAAQ